MPGKLLKVISEMININEYSGDLEEGLSEGKNLLFLQLNPQRALELVSMTGSLM